MFEKIAEGEIAQGFEFVRLDMAQTIVGCKLIIDAAGLFEGIGEGAVEVEDDGAVVHGFILEFGAASEGAVEQGRGENFLDCAKAERASVEKKRFIE